MQLVTLDGGVTFFPRDFLDMNAFNSDKAMVITDANNGQDKDSPTTIANQNNGAVTTGRDRRGGEDGDPAADHENDQQVLLIG